jgi:hypothetical protein
MWTDVGQANEHFYAVFVAITQNAIYIILLLNSSRRKANEEYIETFYASEEGVYAADLVL